MTLTVLVWCALGVVTVLLIALTAQVLTHAPATCRTCVDRAARARRRHPSFVAPEDDPRWGRM